MELIYYAKSKYFRQLKLLMIFLFLGISSTFSQKILWESGYPQMSNEILGTYGDPVAMELRFSVSDAPLTNPEIKVSLPTGINVLSVTKESGDTSGGTYAMSVSGQELTITPSGAVSVGAIVDIKVNVTIESCSEVSISFKVDPYSEGVAVANASRTASVNVRKPSVRVLAPIPSITTGGVNVPGDFEVKIDVANGLKAESLQVFLDIDDFTNLSNFRLNGVDISSKVTTTGSRIAILLDQALLSGQLVGTGFATLKFTAVSPIGSSRKIQMSGQYPAEVECSKITTQQLTLTNPSIPGTPNFELPTDDIHRRWVLAGDMDGANLAANTGVVMDGITMSYLRLQYENTGTAGAIQVKNTVTTRRSVPYTYGYIIKDQIQYSIDGGATKKPIPASDVLVVESLVEDNGYRKLKPGLAGLPEKVTVTINEAIDVGRNVIIYWPIIQGDIYDDDTYRPTVSAGASPNSSLQFMLYDINGLGGNGEAAGKPSNTFGNGGINLPKFMTSLSSQGLREGEHEDSEITFDLGTLSKADNQSVDLNIKLPSFIELDGTMEEAIQLTGVTVLEEVYTDLGNGHYRVRYIVNPTRPDPITGNPVGTAINNLFFKYKVKDGECTGANEAGEIEYWLDYNLGGNNPLRPQLKKIAKLYQPVMLFCEADGIGMKEFSLFRVTRGLKDSDENYIPDDGQPALDSEIRHNVYLKNDEGKIMLTGGTLGAYNNLYMLLTTNFRLVDEILKVSDATIKVGDGAEESIQLTQYQNEMTFYIEYNKPIPANTDVTITIPFKATAADNLTKTFDVELYVSNTKQTDPFAPVDRVGEDKTGRTMIIYQEALATDKGNEVFADNSVRAAVGLPYFDSYHGNNFYTPYFSKEVRRLAKPQTYEFELPAGFLLKSGLTILNNQRRDQQVIDHPNFIVPVTKVGELASGNTLYSADLTTIFEDNVNTQAQADALPPTKWMHPDDIFYYTFGVDIQATKGAAEITKVQGTISYIDAVEGDILQTKTKEFNMSYTGDRIELDITPNEIKVQEQIIHIPVATVGNPNTYAAEMWIYIEGNVKNVSVTPIPSGTKINGTGLDGRWVHLGALPPHSAPDYSIDFEPIETICSPDTIKVYTVSRFQDGEWTPDVNSPVDPNDAEHTAAYRSVFLEPTLATIQASMMTSSNSLVYDTPYTLTASLDSKASESALVDSQMVIAIPVGQKYVAGTAKVEYPKGTFNPVSAAVEAELISILASDANLANSREFTMNVNDLIGSNILHGFGDNTVTDNDRIVSLVMDFTPMCESPLVGIRFEGSPSGENFCGVLALGSDKHERSVEMLSTLTSDYEFAVNSSIVSGNRAFNEIRTEDQLKIDVAKSQGVDILSSTDALYVYLPKYMDLKDATNINITSTDIPAVNGTKATVESNEVVDGTRTVVLKLPIDDINATTDHGLGYELSYTIDLIYTPDRSDENLVKKPVQTIKSVVTTDKAFSPSCPQSPLAIGANEFDVALVTATENPYTGEVGTEMTLEIMSSAFVGEWFDVETGGTALSSEATYNYTPVSSDEVTFYVSSVFDGVDYGRVPVIVTSLPTLDFTVTDPAPQCIGSQVDLSSLVSGYASGVTIKYYSDEDLTNEITNPLVTISGNASYYVTASNSSTTSQAKEIVVQVLAATAITTQPIAVDVSTSGTISLTVEATGDNLSYQWKKDDVDIDGATNATYTKDNAEDADNGVYSVEVTGTCGAITSSTAQVTVHPSPEDGVVVTQPSPVCSSESIDLRTCVTVESGITVKFYSDAAGTNEVTNPVVTITGNVSYYVIASNGLITGTAKEIAIEALAATVITTQPIAVDVSTSGTISLTVEATGDNLSYQWKKDDVDIDGATNATYTKDDAEDADNGVYSVEVTGTCGAITSSTAQVTVHPSPEDGVVVTQPSPVCSSESIDLRTCVTVEPGITVKFYSDAAGTNEVTNPVVTITGNVSYYVIASNGLITGTAKEIAIEALAATVITTQPIAVDISKSGTISLTVEATGDNLSYQWKKDDVDIDGATNATYTKDDAEDADNGVYSVEVTGTCGAITSSTAQVSVHPSPEDGAVVTQPSPVCSSESIDLRTCVTVESGITVKFYSDAAGTNEVTNPVVTITGNVSYYMIASNGLVTGTAKEIAVRTLATTAITTQPIAVDVSMSETISLTVAATGDNLSYQWMKDGANITGATDATYTKTNATDADNGVYSVEVTGACGTVTSSTAQVTVHPSVGDGIVVTQPSPVCSSESIDLRDYVTAKPGVTVKFYFDAAGTNEVTNPIVVINGNVSYYVIASNGLVTGTAKEIAVRTLATTAITVQPVAMNVNANGSIKLTVTATGDNLSYQWMKDGANITGATDATYTKANATDADNGVYSVEVTGACGTVTSRDAQVMVYPSTDDLTVTMPSPICEAETIDLASLVSTKAGISFKYYSDASATNELPSSVVSPTTTTTYYVKAMNSGGMETIYPIEVRVNASAQATILSATESVCANTEAEVTVSLTGTAPWTVTYSDGTSQHTITTSESNHTFKVQVNKDITISLITVSDALNCGNGKVDGTSVTIRVDEELSIITQPSSTTYCEGETVSIDVEVTGSVVQYQWYHNGSIMPGQASPHLTIINGRKDAAGQYYVVAVGKCGSVTSNTVTATPSLSDIIVQKWNNTLVANNNSATNGGYNFVSYKWFRDGTLVDQRPYHTVGDNPTNMLEMGTPYVLEVTTDKGEIFMTCPFYPALKNTSVKLYPTMVNANEPVYLEVETEDGAAPRGKVEIYNISGNTFKSPEVLERVTSITLPTAPGVYVVKFKSATIDKDFKVIVK